jgi:3-hydroxyisobutyrate dehydrogenase-like beta-hydroxyacid dehydrogenase
MKHLIVGLVGLTLMASPAFAAKHCVDKSGHEIRVSPAKGKKAAAQCRANGGTWKKVPRTTAKKRN